MGAISLVGAVQLGARLRGISPPVVRTLQVSERTSLAELHQILRVSCGWNDVRPYTFVSYPNPMYPIGSNGATQGLIDARSLAYFPAFEPSAEGALARYENDRREVTSRIVLTNRAHGPDQVLEVARLRLQQGAADLESAVPVAERREIADDYNQVAGFNPASLRPDTLYTATARTPG